MEECIGKHLTEPITLRMLADAAGYSPWHSARLFKEMTGQTPFEYIRAARLSQAAVRLRRGDVKVVDVAFDFVFDSHEGFTRAFSRQFGMTPRDYCRTVPPVPLFMPARLQDYYLKVQNGGQNMPGKAKTKTVFVQVVERPARRLILKRGVKATHYFEYCEEVGCDVWDVLSAVKEALYEPIGMWLPRNLRRPGSSAYAQGVEVPADYAGAVPDGFDLIDLPPCQMMVFQGQPFQDEKFESAIGEIWEVMKSYKPEIYGFRWADRDGPRFQLAPLGYRGYIEARPVRQVGTG